MRHEIPRRIWVAAGLLLLSGAGSLVLEVVWSRLLKLVFGSSTLAISTVLVAYMLGLGIGGLLGGRFARRVHGMRAYAKLELGIAVYAVTVPLLLSGLAALWWLWFGELSFWPSSLARFALALCAMLTPTILMGATLPVLLAGLAPDGAVGHRAIGLLYGANTLGAVFGTVLATFVLFPWVGVRWTNAIGALLDLTAAGIAWYLARGAVESTTASSQAPQRPTPHAVNWAAVSYGVVGATALSSEVCWTRGLGMVFGSSTYAFAAMLATFLFGIALGSLLVRSWLDRIQRPYRLYALGMVAFAASSLVGLVLLGYTNDMFVWLYLTFGISGRTVVLASFGLSMVTMLLPTLVLGSLFPLLATALARDRGTARAVGDLYFANTLGSALGAFLAGFALIPWLGLARTLLVGAALNAFVAAAVLLWQKEWTSVWRHRLAAAAVVAGVVIALLPSGWSESKMTRGAYYHIKRAIEFGMPPEPLEGYPREEILMYKDGPSATVSIHSGPGGIDMRINAKTDASLADMSTQVLSGHLPVLFGAPPQRACVIGYASGVTTGAVALYQPAQLDVIEIEPAVVDGSRFFEPLNHQPLEKPGIRLIIEDGRAWLAKTSERYDLIISEPSNPFLAGAANLFTREFFQIAHRALQPGGRLLQWIQLYGLDPQGLGSVLAGVRSEFKHVYGFQFRAGTGDLMLLASDEPLDPTNFPRLPALSAGVQQDLERIGIVTTAQLWSVLRLTDEDTAALAQLSSQANTDDSMFIELRAPWLLHAETSANQREMDQRVDSTVAMLNRAAGNDIRLRAELALAELQERGNVAIAERLIGAPQAGDPQELVAMRAVLSLAQGRQPGESVSAIDPLADAEPAWPELLYWRAVQRRGASDAERALIDIRRARAGTPDDPRLLVTEIDALGTLRRFDEALPLARTLVARPFADFLPNVIASSGMIFAAAGDFETGSATLRRYLDLVRDAPEEWRLYSGMMRKLGRTGDAFVADRNAVIATRNQTHGYHRLALLALHKGERPEAIELLRELRRLHPGYAPAEAELRKLGVKS